jgi:hypothetical protein
MIFAFISDVLARTLRADARSALIRRGFAASGTYSEKELAYKVACWYDAHPAIPRPSSALDALRVYLSYVEQKR